MDNTTITASDYLIHLTYMRKTSKNIIGKFQKKNAKREPIARQAIQGAGYPRRDAVEKWCSWIEFSPKGQVLVSHLHHREWFLVGIWILWHAVERGKDVYLESNPTVSDRNKWFILRACTFLFNEWDCTYFFHFHFHF